jgi:hypothetical protein
VEWFDRWHLLEVNDLLIPERGEAVDLLGRKGFDHRLVIDEKRIALWPREGRRLGLSKRREGSAKSQSSGERYIQIVVQEVLDAGRGWGAKPSIGQGNVNIQRVGESRLLALPCADERALRRDKTDHAH